MSSKERKRKVIMESVVEGSITLKEGADHMEVSYRHAKRIKSRYLMQGDVGLIHGNRGSPSGHAKPDDFKDKVLELYEHKYFGFGPTLASEFMAEEDEINIHPETLRLWVKAEGLWTRQRKRSPYRQRRERKQRFGELLQIDGSDHHWFGEDRARCCLLNMVDDATGTTLARLDTGETTMVLLTVLMKWIKRYGIPLAVYVDLKSVYVSPVKESWSVFEHVCDKLGIKIIRAYSPQAKGRVERKHGVFQDRYVKELYLKGIKEIDPANALLDKSVLAKFNKKFAKAPSDPTDAHREASHFGDLHQVICWEYKRQVKNDYTIRYNNRYYQLSKSAYTVVSPKQEVRIREHLDGRMSLWYAGERLKYVALKERPANIEKQPSEKKVLGPSRSEIARQTKHKSPWKDNLMLKKRTINACGKGLGGDIINLVTEGTY